MTYEYDFDMVKRAYAEMARRAREKDEIRRLPRNGPSTQPQQRPARLTEREVAALNALASGKVNKQLAEILGVAESTFKTHLRAIYRKLGVRTRVQAVGRARQLGLIQAVRSA